jgi:hypothetical protein
MVNKPRRDEENWDVVLNAALDDLQGQQTNLSTTVAGHTGTLSSLSSTVAGHTGTIGSLSGTTSAQTASITDLSTRTSALEDLVAGGGGGNNRTWEIVVGGTSDAAVQNAITAALNAPVSNNVQKRIIFPPGVYNLTTPLITAGGASTQYNNLWIEGAGIGSTTINWDNASSPWIDTTNKRFRWMTIRGMTFTSLNAANRWGYLFSTGSPFNQGWHLSDLNFTGSWDYVIGLDGGTSANLNSEMRMERIFTATNSVFSNAFFVSGLSDVSAENQFLNYWIYDTAFTVSDGVLFKFNRGGAVHFHGGSWSAQSTTGTITFFKATRGNSNNPTDNMVSFHGVRFEPKSDQHVVLDSAWADGFINFTSCSDGGSTQNTGSYTHPRYKIADNNIWVTGVAPMLRFTNGAHGGYIQYTGTTTQKRGGVIVDGCKWYRGDTGQAANRIAADGADAILQAVSGTPRYDFRSGWNYLDLKSWS